MTKPVASVIPWRRWKRVAVALAAVLLTSACAVPSHGQEVVVHAHRTINSGTLGLGVQWDPYAYPPSVRDWKIILQRVSFMRPGFLRVMGMNADWKAQPEVSMILRWAQKHGCKVILGTWWPLPLDNQYKHTPMPPRQLDRWANKIAGGIARLRKTDGFTCIRYYNFINEPQTVSIQRWAYVAAALNAALARAGLAQAVKIIGPDTYGDPGKNPHYNFPLLPQVARYASHTVGLYDIHWYPKNAEVCNGLIEPALVREKRLVVSIDHTAVRKPFVVSEAGLIDGRCNGDQQPHVKTFAYGVRMADYAAQVFRAGWNGVSAWDLDDAMHVVNGKLITHPPGPLTLKIWGFWNSQGAVMGDRADFNIRPWFYTWSLMSRMFPAGTRIIDCTEPLNARRFRTMAGIRMIHGHRILSVLLVNDARTSRLIKVDIPCCTRSTTFTEYRYFRKDRPVDAQGFPMAAKILHVMLPARGITIVLPTRGVVFLSNQPPFSCP